MESVLPFMLELSDEFCGDADKFDELFLIQDLIDQVNDDLKLQYTKNRFL